MNWRQLLVTHCWWQYDAQDPLHQVYHYFNLLEGLVWVALALAVLRRYLRHRCTRWELAYAAAYFVFGLSDFREAHRLESWLIGAKGVILAMLVGLRAYVLRRCYPGRKVY